MDLNRLSRGIARAKARELLTGLLHTNFILSEKHCTIHEILYAWLEALFETKRMRMVATHEPPN